MRILLVEDDSRIAAPVNKGLSEEGCSVTYVADGNTALQRACAETFDVIVLDILLPRRDGWSVLHELRKRGNRTPVLMLTALNSVDDRVHGLNDGADDYLTKPFAFAELLARIRALSRRGHDAPLLPLHVADITLEPVSRKALRGDKALVLSPREYELLEYFLRNVGRTLTRIELAEHVWGYHHECGTNVIDVYVNYLRRKIDLGRRNKLLRTVRGVGYVLSENPHLDE